MSGPNLLEGKRSVISIADENYPIAFSRLKSPPKNLYVIGDICALSEGLAIIGARSATPYGLSCAEKFGRMAGECGITVISGGARGCDAAAHKAALSVRGKTVAFLGGGCDDIYPKENHRLFQQIIDNGGAVVSENEWKTPPKPYHFRARNRLIASLAKATLIVEAGLPSGTFSTADEALAAGRELLVVPGSIASKNSYGANRLIYQGAVPIIDEETFKDQLRSIFSILAMSSPKAPSQDKDDPDSSIEEILFEAICSKPITSDELLGLVNESRGAGDDMIWMMQWLSDMQRQGRIARYANGAYGPVAL